MERRWNERKHVKLNAMINSSEMMIRGTTENIGMGGLYLKIAPGIRVKNNQPVSISLFDHDHPVSLRATIVRIEGDKLGLKISDYNRDVLKLLRHLLEDEPFQNPALQTRIH